jgi:predicted  nucleic acid-binding Zn ribbon protein
MDRKYARLYPPGPTDDSELCKCSQRSLKMMQTLGYNPIHCMDCNREVPPERLGLEERHIQALAHWRHIYDAIDRLWLDSGDYEAWACAQLADPNSGVNQMGRRVCKELQEVSRFYYYCFQNEPEESEEPVRVCPICEGDLEDYPSRIPQQVCQECSLVFFVQDGIGSVCSVPPRNDGV